LFLKTLLQGIDNNYKKKTGMGKHKENSSQGCAKKATPKKNSL
jgi:hypothetical protein